MAKSSGYAKSATTKANYGKSGSKGYISRIADFCNITGKVGGLQNYKGIPEFMHYSKQLYSFKILKHRLYSMKNPQPIDLEEWFRKLQKRFCDSEDKAVNQNYRFN